MYILKYKNILLYNTSIVIKVRQFHTVPELIMKFSYIQISAFLLLIPFVVKSSQPPPQIQV